MNHIFWTHNYLMYRCLSVNQGIIHHFLDLLLQKNDDQFKMQQYNLILLILSIFTVFRGFNPTYMFGNISKPM
jgi:hypothetical protein